MTAFIKKHRKLLIMLPVFLIPVGIIFFGIFVRPSSTAENPADSTSSAFNRHIPTANAEKKPKNKLEAYLFAQADSAQRQQALKADPYLADTVVPIFNPLPDDYQPPAAAWPNQRRASSHDKELDERLQKIYDALQQSETEPIAAPALAAPSVPAGYDPERMEKLLQELASANSDDADMVKLEAVMEKALDLQHPQRVRDRMQKQSAGSTESPLRVGLYPPFSADSAIRYSTSSHLARNAFYPITSAVTAGDDQNSFVKAVIHDDQSVIDGQTVKLRLLQNIYIGATCIPRHSFVHGTAGRSGDRLTINIRHITYQQMVYPVALQVFDAVDGMEGLRIEGAESQDASKESLQQAIGQIQLASIDPSIGQQAAASGLQTLQTLLNRKIRKKPVTLKSGHDVLLKIQQQ